MRFANKSEFLGPTLLQAELFRDLVVQSLNLINGPALVCLSSRSNFVCFGDAFGFCGDILAVNSAIKAES
jgi:hypothetical protein